MMISGISLLLGDYAITMTIYLHAHVNERTVRRRPETKHKFLAQIAGVPFIYDET
jgi:hypothetical protein